MNEQMFYNEMSRKFKVDHNGLPLNRLNAFSCNGITYFIVPAESLEERYDCETGKLAKTQYAVFSDCEIGVVSRWYNNYGSAVRKMLSFGRVKEWKH